MGTTCMAHLSKSRCHVEAGTIRKTTKNKIERKKRKKKKTEASEENTV